LFDLNEWRLNNIKEQCLRIAKQYPMELLSCDQSLLNAIFAGKFAYLPAQFNCAWYAEKPRPVIAEKMILHFVGSPKPWDPFAFLFHNGYYTWRKYLTPEWNTFFGRLNLADISRAWNIRRSYLRSIQRKLKV
jgi:lipopolysaccharide biosynthesis glycosyltransferase